MPLKLLYAGAYLVRNVDQVQDYTSYAHAAPTSTTTSASIRARHPATARCFTPSATWRDHERNTHQSQELRLSTPDDWRIRGVGGLFYEKYLHPGPDRLVLPDRAARTSIRSRRRPALHRERHVSDFPYSRLTSNNPDIRGRPGDAFFNDITRGYKQKAAYASVDFDLLPHQLTLTAGTRYFNIDTSEVGSTVCSFGCQIYIFNPTGA